MGASSLATQSKDTSPMHDEAFVRVILRAHVQQLWAKSTTLVLWSWLWRSLIGYARELIGWQADKQLCCWLEAGKVTREKRKRASQKQCIEKVKALESQQKRDLRRATIRKVECASSKARESFEQESERCSLRRCTGLGRDPSESARTGKRNWQLSEWANDANKEGTKRIEKKMKMRKESWKRRKGLDNTYAMGKRRGAVGARLARSRGRQTRSGRHL